MNHRVNRNSNLSLYEHIERFYIRACESIKKKNKLIFIKPDWKIKFEIPIDTKPINDKVIIVLYSNGVKHITEKKSKYTISLQCIFSLKYDVFPEKFDGLVFIDYRRKWISTTNELDEKRTSMNWSQDIPMLFVHSKEYMKYIEFIEEVLENIIRDYIRFQIIPHMEVKNETVSNTTSTVSTPDSNSEVDSEPVSSQILIAKSVPVKKITPVKNTIQPDVKTKSEESSKKDIDVKKEDFFITDEDQEIIDICEVSKKGLKNNQQISCFFEEPQTNHVSVEELPVHYFTERPFYFTPVQSPSILVRTNSFDVVSNKIVSRNVSKNDLERMVRKNSLDLVFNKMFNTIDEKNSDLEHYNKNNDTVTISSELYNLLIRLSNENLGKIESLIIPK